VCTGGAIQYRGLSLAESALQHALSQLGWPKYAADLRYPPYLYRVFWYVCDSVRAAASSVRAGVVFVSLGLFLSGGYRGSLLALFSGNLVADQSRGGAVAVCVPDVNEKGAWRRMSIALQQGQLAVRLSP